MVLSKVASALEKMNITPSTHITVGLSGGADSVCLLHCLKTLGYPLRAVHVNHGIRGEEAARDAEFSRGLCDALGVEFVLVEWDVPAYARSKRLTPEQAAREVRYGALFEHTDELLAVAHNLNDQAETVLLRLVRGTGIDGLRAMSARSGRIIRPLLEVTRAEIEQYLSKNRLEHITDSTNCEDIYSRNAVRLRVLPELERINPAAVRSICRTAELAGEDAELIAECVSKHEGRITVNGDVAVVDVRGFDELGAAITKRLLRTAISRIDSLVDVEQAHVNACMELIKGQSGRSVSLPRGLVATYSGGSLVFGREHQKREWEIPFKEGCFDIQGRTVCIKAVNAMAEREKDCEYVALCDICGLVLRNRRDGDRIRPIGASGGKSLKKYLIDKKIPLHERDGLVLLARGEDVLAVVGITVADEVAVGKNEGKIYKISVR